MTASTKAAFTTVVLDPQGRVATQRIEATSVEQARQIAGSQGHTVLECTAQDVRDGTAGFLARFRLGEPATVDTVAFSQDLATMISEAACLRVDPVPQTPAGSRRSPVPCPGSKLNH